MAYCANTILRLFNADNIHKATAIVMKTGEIMQLKPARQVFKTLGEWHTDEDQYMKVEKPGLNSDFLLFKKYEPVSNLDYIISETALLAKRKQQFNNMTISPECYLSTINHQHMFYKHVHGHSGIKTIRDADLYLQEYIKKGLGAKVNSYIYKGFTEVVRTSNLQPNHPIDAILQIVEKASAKNMRESYTYNELEKSIKDMESRTLSDKPTYAPTSILPRHYDTDGIFPKRLPSLFVWQNRNMKVINVNYQRKVFTLGGDTTTYKTLKSAGIDKTELFHLDKTTRCIVPVFIEVDKSEVSVPMATAMATAVPVADTPGQVGQKANELTKKVVKKIVNTNRPIV